MMWWVHIARLVPLSRSAWQDRVGTTFAAPVLTSWNRQPDKERRCLATRSPSRTRRHDRVRAPRELVDAFASALNAKNADELGRLFTEDAEFVNIMGMRMRRRAGIVDGHAWAFAGPLRGRHIRFDQVDELKVTDDVTVLHGHCVRERQPDGPVEGLPDGASVLVFVTRRGAQGWQIAAATNVTEAAPPGR